MDKENRKKNQTIQIKGRNIICHRGAEKMAHISKGRHIPENAKFGEQNSTRSWIGDRGLKYRPEAPKMWFFFHDTAIQYANFTPQAIFLPLFWPPFHWFCHVFMSLISPLTFVFSFFHFKNFVFFLFPPFIFPPPQKNCTSQFPLPRHPGRRGRGVFSNSGV